MTYSLINLLTSSTAASFFALVAIKTTTVMLIGLLFWSLLGKASAGTRHLVLVATLLGAVVTPLVLTVVPPLELQVPVSEPQLVQNVEAPISSDAVAPRVTETLSRLDANQSLQAIVPNRESHNTSKNTLLAMACISVALVGHLAFGMVRLWRLCRRASVISTTDSWYTLFSTPTLERTTLLMSDDITAPCTWGTLNPIILLPSASQNWSAQNRANALLHELAHIERNDWFHQVVARVICSIYWFNPLAWIVYRKLLLEAEHAADDRVLLAGSRADDYAEQLLALSRSANNRQNLTYTATTMATKSMLSDRVHSILNTGVQRMPLQTHHKYIVLVLIAALSLVIGSTQLIAAEPQDSVGIASHDAPPLIHAAATGDYAQIRRLIDAGINVNKTYQKRTDSEIYQRTALTTAAKAGHTDIVAALIDAGAPVDRVVSGDATALIEALRNDHNETAYLLLDRGADVGRSVRGDGSPLIAASGAGNSEMVALLLRKGADVDASQSRDPSALMQAAACGNNEIVQLLVAAGADVNKNMEGEGNALIVAARNGNQAVVRTLLEAGARPDASVSGDGNALISAAQRGDTQTLSLMIATGANVNASIEGDGSPLIAAARNGHADSVRLLLKEGAAIDKVVYGDENALIGAAWAGDVGMVKLLLGAGANPNIKADTYNGKYRTALGQAELEGHSEIIGILKTAGAIQ